MDRNEAAVERQIARMRIKAFPEVSRQSMLELMILKAVALEKAHRLGILGRIKQMTEGTLQVSPSSFFLALRRMEDAGWLASSWGQSESYHRAKYYRLTKEGRRQLESETSRWGRVSWAITRALQAP